MKIVIDMNLSPFWVAFFAENGIEAIHWSSIGLATLLQFEEMLSQGALITLEEHRSRVRILPLKG